MFSSKRGWFFIALHPAIQTEILEISYKNVNGRDLQIVMRDAVNSINLITFSAQAT